MTPSLLSRATMVFALASVTVAAPTTTLFLTPGDFRPAAGEAVEVRFQTGAAETAQAVTWPAGQVRWMFVRGGPAQENRHDVRPRRPGDDFISVKIEHSDVTMVGVDLEPTIVEMTGAELRSSLADNVADADVQRKVRGITATAKLRVRCIASAKTLVRAASPRRRAQPSAIATSKTGLAADMRLLVDPTLCPVGGDVPLRVYIDGDKRSGVKVRATRVGGAASQTFVTDSVGTGHFRLNGAGQWRVEVHDARPLAADDGADWVIHTATLTFQTAASEGGAER